MVCNQLQSPRREHSRSPRPQQPFIVGLDFGTHSTKIVVRERGERAANQARVIQVDPSTEGYPWFASPSLVCIENGKAYFGREAWLRKGGTLYRSLKMHLLPIFETQYVLPPGPSPDVLVACYLAWALQRVRTELAKIGDAPIILNVAAPMSHVEDEVLKLRYLQVIHAAWEATFGGSPCVVRSGMAIGDALKTFATLMDCEVPEASERRFNILPETVASVVSLSETPQMAPGMYVIIDMGAGTTEFSVAHVSGAGLGQPILCYADKSVPNGANDLEAIHTEDSSGQHEALLQTFAKTYKGVWNVGYWKDADNIPSRARWKRRTLLLCGGGTRRADVRDALERVDPWPANDPETSVEVRTHMPTEINWNGNSDVDMIRRDASLIAVAHGLSIERQRWPVVFAPAQVEPMEPSEVAEKPEAYSHVER